MQARSLRARLVLRWVAFAACVAVLFASAGLLLLFTLEDSFIDRQLEAAGRSVATEFPNMERLPAEFSVYPVETAPLDIHARLPFAKPGEPFEMRRANRRHVHVLLVDSADQVRLAVVYDVTDQLTVTPHISAGLIFVLGLTGLALLAAAAFAQAFVGRITRQASQLIEDVKRTPDPARLRELARSQQVIEFRHLLGLHADVREAQLAAIARERQTLAYLAHELRTPLQSAQASLAVLADSPRDEAAHARLSRAISRLSRATQAVLWLATDREPDMSVLQPALPLVRALVDELDSLARSVGKPISIDLPADLSFRGPTEIAEVILANVLLNAIQHGSGPVHIGFAVDSIVISNPIRDIGDAHGFGLGTGIVQRLAQRVHWHIEHLRESGHMRTRIRLAIT